MNLHAIISCMKINVVYNNKIEGYQSILEELEKTLIEKKVEFKSFELDSMENFGEFSFVIGGDGTLLKAAKFYSSNSVPVLGINIGRLGFLSQACINEIEKAVESVLQKEYKIEERIMLEADGVLALNDFVIKGCSASRTSKFYLEINKQCVCDYIADGLIISTPTGSTAYGLSAGGPVVHPTLNALVIVPVCPHTLTSRPLVVPTEEEITVKSADGYFSLSSDGKVIDNRKDVKIKLSKNKAQLVFLNNDSFYSVLRNKLHWGISPCRN